MRDCLSYNHKRTVEQGGVPNNMMNISDFQVKDVVNVSNGKRLGSIGDIDINVTTGKIQAIVIGGTGRIFGFFGKKRRSLFRGEI